jgi:preprotein translocase subunit Sec63
MQMDLIEHDEQDSRKNQIFLIKINSNKKFFVIYFSKIAFGIAWIILIILAYRVSTIEIEHKDYDPFAILDMDRVNILNNYIKLKKK